MTAVKRLRVCMVVDRFYPQVGGAETQALSLSQKLKNVGIDLFILTRRTLKEMAPVEDVKGIRVYRVLPIGIGKLSLLMASFSFAYFLFKKRNDYDIIHCHGMGWAGPVSSLLGYLLKKKTIVKVATAGDVSGKIVGKKDIPTVINAIRLAVLKKATKVVCISREIAEELRNKGFRTDRLAHIPNGVDIDRFKPREGARRIFPPDRLYITFTGRIVYRKGLDILFKAFKDIAKEHPEVHLAILGSSSLQVYTDYEREMRLFVEANRLEESVTFYGDVDNVEDYLREADIFAFPSRHEGLPNALLEAMACGLPVVATSIGGVVDIVKDGENGILVEPDNAKELNAALKRLIEDPDLRFRLGTAARERVIKGYSLKTIAHKYVGLYSNMISGG